MGTDITITSTTPGPCGCCGNVAPPVNCNCSLLIPVPAGGSPFANYGAAANAIANFAGSCVGYLLTPSMAPFSNFAADQSTTPNTLYMNADATLTGFGLWCSFNGDASTTLNVAFNVSGIAVGPNVSYTLYECGGTAINTQAFTNGVSSGAFLYALPNTGEYVVTANYHGTLSVSAAMNIIVSAPNIAFNPVVALWDDGGTTRPLDACPRMVLPPLTEFSGFIYADLSEAEAVFASGNVSNCVGFVETDAPDGASFSATEISSGLELNGGAGGDMSFAPTVTMYGSLNFASGETISVNWSCDQILDSFVVGATLYDYDAIELDSAITSTVNAPIDNGLFTFSAPYTGRYIIKCQVTGVTFADPPGPDQGIAQANFSITGPTTNTHANPLLALYANGVKCPSRLECS